MGALRCDPGELEVGGHSKQGGVAEGRGGRMSYVKAGAWLVRVGTGDR